MNCSDVKNKLTHYLSDECSPEEKFEISKHISTCPECMQALEELDKPILKNISNIKPLDTGKLLNNARKALVLKVTATTIASIIIIISTFFVLIPGILKTIQYPKITNITRSLIDIVQFTSPSPVGGYGNSLASFGSYSFNISAYTHDITGIKKKDPREINRNFNLLTGTFKSPAPHLSQFIHPSVKVSDEFLSRITPDIAKKILTKNGDTTVATVDLSLKATLSLDEVTAALEDLDLKVIWMAVECGSEGEQPKNMSTGKNQYIQWGIPGQLFNANNSNSPEFKLSNVSEYEKSIMEELKWLDENKHYITADKSLLKFNDLDNSVGNRAKYIIDNGIKVYGLRITGPSSELSKLDARLSIRAEEVIDIDFYYWN